NRLGSCPLCHLSALILLFPPQPSTPDIHTLSLHDALPISSPPIDMDARRAASKQAFEANLPSTPGSQIKAVGSQVAADAVGTVQDRKSTRLNSSHVAISYAVFCLKKKK